MSENDERIEILKGGWGWGGQISEERARDPKREDRDPRSSRE